ncbi:MULTISPECIES: helix-turn-helix transcriptional regulator [unclassified Dietzia]|uniref:helix-turn-helix transcriptional regulator n=1 Tax=unclassified Dietzia TaxID=2617939 RepID=UPI0015FDDF2D|nr:MULTISPECIES: LuxR C-terminal-related transcriptional regulator [unclassified Dietzia]MBB1024491.1 hypothetical protein [Dietzia sp. DQ12-76]MBB1028407.1 hypothetical protein [Dietzia sp. DQ11-38-2]
MVASRPAPGVAGPVPNPQSPPRTRLFDALSGPERLVVVRGPLLSGKTTLLRRWSAASASPGAVAGVIGPEPGSTPDAYWQEVATSLPEQRDADAPTVGPVGARRTATDPPADPFDQVKSLVRTWRGPLTLVLDDLHLVGEPENRVRDLFEQSSGGMVRVLVATRTAGAWHEAPGLPADRVFVPPADLLLTDAELDAAIDLAGLTTASAIPLGEVAAETGRIAGLVDKGVGALRTGSPARADRVGRIRSVVDRVVVRVLAETAELHRHRREIFCAATATPLTASSVGVAIGGVTGRVNAVGDVFVALERHGLTVREAGAAEPTWSFPDPIRASLLRIAATERPEDLRDARIALIDHWLSEGRPHTAFVHAIDAERWDLVLDILRAHWKTLYTTNFLHMDGDLKRIPPEVLESESLFGTLRRMHSQFSAPKDSPAPPPDLVDSPEVSDDAERLMRMISLRIDGRFEKAAAEYEMLRRVPAPDVESSTQSERDGPAFVFLHLGLTLLLVGRFDDAHQMLRRGHRLGVGSFIERDAAGKLTLVNAILGHVRDADSWWDEEQRHPQLPHNSELVVRPAGMIGSALARLERLDIDSAIDLMTDLGPPADQEELWGFSLYVYGQIALAAGTPADGLRYVEHHMRRFPGLRADGAVVGPLLDAVRADLHLAMGRTAVAFDLLGGSTHPLTAPARARARLYDGEHAGALGVVRDHYGDLGCTQRDSLELSLVGAAAWIGLGNREEAVTYLERAITTSTLTGVVRPFVTLAPGTLATLATLGPELPPPVRDATPPSPAPGSTELTGRELAILASLATGDSITAIARQHFVSANTVKTQLRSAYRKLGVRSRDAAVDEARRRGLV